MRQSPSEAIEQIKKIRKIYTNIRNFSSDVCKKYKSFNNPNVAGGSYVPDLDNPKQLQCLEDIIEEMEIYLAELNDEKYKQVKQNNPNSININNQNNNTANATVNQNINLEFTLKSISEISNEILDEESKEYLEEILCSIDALKDKDREKTKEKIAKTLKYVADKGIEVWIAVLPYLDKIVSFLR